MTEQANIALMDRNEFEEHHARTGQWIARVGKIWEAVAEEQQAIIDGAGYKYLDYGSWSAYWTSEWEEASGWTYHTVRTWLKAKKVKDSMSRPTHWEPESAYQWGVLSRIPGEDRPEFLDRYKTELEPKIKSEGETRHVFQEAVKEFKGEREPTVRETLSPGQMADLPSPRLNEAEKWVYQTGKISAALRTLDPEEVADHAYQFMPNKLHWEVDEANKIIEWYEHYKQALQARRNQGLKAVK